MRKYIIALILLGALEIALSLYLTTWREHFWNAISNRQGMDFIHQLIIFTGVALTICITSGASGYTLSLLSIRWRRILNAKALKASHSVENANQRVQEDAMAYPDLMLGLSVGAIKALFYVIVFSVSLMCSYNAFYLVILFVYAMIGMAVTHYIAKPLIHLNYEQQRAEATYRNNLSITNFKDCVYIMLGLAKKQKHLTYFQQFYGQLGVIVPLLLIAPLYFTTSMALGSLMRFNSLGSTILDNLLYGVNSFGMLNKLISCRKRLKEIGII